jgi:hypothetical protein
MSRVAVHCAKKWIPACGFMEERHMILLWMKGANSMENKIPKPKNYYCSYAAEINSLPRASKEG